MGIFYWSELLAIALRELMVAPNEYEKARSIKQCWQLAGPWQTREYSYSFWFCYLVFSVKLENSIQAFQYW